MWLYVQLCMLYWTGNWPECRCWRTSRWILWWSKYVALQYSCVWCLLDTVGPTLSACDKLCVMITLVTSCVLSILFSLNSNLLQYIVNTWLILGNFLDVFNGGKLWVCSQVHSALVVPWCKTSCKLCLALMKLWAILKLWSSLIFLIFCSRYFSREWLLVVETCCYDCNACDWLVIIIVVIMIINIKHCVPVTLWT